MRGAGMLLASVALALAGCAAPADPPAPSSAGGVSIGFAECEQTHTFVPYPVEAFAGMVPEGWSLQPADAAGRTTQFYLAGSRCAASNVSTASGIATLGESKEVWGYLFVVPPGGANESYDGELWPLGATVSHGDMLRAYQAWGFSDLVVQGETDLTMDEPAPGALASRTWADNGGEQFEVRGAARSGEAAFHEGAFRVWIPSEDEEDEDGVAGAIRYAWPEGGTDLGLGSGTMEYDGPLLNAPPATPAVVHHVRGVSVDVREAA